MQAASHAFFSSLVRRALMVRPRADSTPPKPMLALNVGFVAHAALAAEGARTDAVAHSLGRVLDELREAVRNAYDQYEEWQDPTIRIAMIASLVNDAELLGARTALEAGFPFDVVLPCAGPNCEERFETIASRVEFWELLSKARALLTLPGVGGPTRPKPGSGCYAEAGRTVLARSDLLICVWDGVEAPGAGAAMETIDDAARQATPIIVIGSSGETSLRWCGDFDLPMPAQQAAELPARPLDAATVQALVKSLICPPEWRGALAEYASDSEIRGLRDYLATPTKRISWHVGWKLLHFVLGAKFLRHGDKPKPQPASAAYERSLALGLNLTTVAALEKALQAADRVALYYSDAFRTAFIVNFVFGAAALLSVASTFVSDEDPPARSAATEFFCVVVVILTATVANYWRWRHRWLEARETAERLRLAEPFWMAGVWPHTPSADQPAWPGWYVRALLRQQPMFSGNLAELARDVQARLCDIIDEQIHYHGKAIRTSKHCDAVLERIGKWAVFLSIVEPSVLLSAKLRIWQPSDNVDNWLSFFAIALPALATACYGIRLLADFEDTALRSERARGKLQKLKGLLDARSLSELRIRARQLSATMLADVESWRVAVESRNLSV